jgi:chromate transporter
MLQAVVIASAGLLLAASIPLARDALTDPVTCAIAIVSLITLLTSALIGARAAKLPVAITTA